MCVSFCVYYNNIVFCISPWIHQSIYKNNHDIMYILSIRPLW